MYRSTIPFSRPDLVGRVNPPVGLAPLTAAYRSISRRGSGDDQGHILAAGAAGYLGIYPFAFFMIPDY